MDDPDDVTTNNAFEQQFSPLVDEPVDDVLEMSEDVHVAFLVLIESESFEVFRGAAPSGLEALRRSVLSLGSSEWRESAQQCCDKSWCKLQDLPAELKKWEELMRRYEKQIERNDDSRS